MWKIRDDVKEIIQAIWKPAALRPHRPPSAMAPPASPQAAPGWGTDTPMPTLTHPHGHTRTQPLHMHTTHVHTYAHTPFARTRVHTRSPTPPQLTPTLTLTSVHTHTYTTHPPNPSHTHTIHHTCKPTHMHTHSHPPHTPTLTNTGLLTPTPTCTLPPYPLTLVHTLAHLHTQEHKPIPPTHNRTLCPHTHTDTRAHTDGCPLHAPCTLAQPGLLCPLPEVPSVPAHPISSPGRSSPTYTFTRFPRTHLILHRLQTHACARPHRPMPQGSGLTVLRRLHPGTEAPSSARSAACGLRPPPWWMGHGFPACPSLWPT